MQKIEYYCLLQSSYKPIGKRILIEQQCYLLYKKTTLFFNLMFLLFSFLVWKKHVWTKFTLTVKITTEINNGKMH